MNDAARESVEKLVAAGDWPDPALLDEILAHGEAAIEPLWDVLRRGLADEEQASWATDLSLNLLGVLRAREALPDMIAVFRAFDGDDILDGVRHIVGSFGSEVIEPMLALVPDTTLDWYTRTSAVLAARTAAGDDLAGRQRIAEALRDVLRDCIARGAEDGDDYAFASFLVNDVAELADPLARDLIDQAFAAGLIDETIVNQENIEELYAKGGENPEPSDPSSWMIDYRETHKEQLEWEARRAEYESFPVRSYDPVAYEEPEEYVPPPAIEPIRYTRTRPGRNDPCWCGSGKKYKKCHLSRDEAGGSQV